ncbi:MAG: hypothetical protein MPJ78_03690 [Hyphomicrobiaceae bacterium]|nr:hypothetical protein [Hyphomicrobiaceae bacterium]
MTQSAIFAPVFATFFLTMLVWIYMYARRIPYIRRNNFTPEELRPITFADRSPPEVSNPADNLKNLFETPILFYAMAMYLYVSG